MAFGATRTKLQETLARKEAMRRMRLSRAVELWISALAYSKGEALSKRDRETNTSFPGSPFEHNEVLERGSNPKNLPWKRKRPPLLEVFELVVGDEGFEPPALCL